MLITSKVSNPFSIINRVLQIVILWTIIIVSNKLAHFPKCYYGDPMKISLYFSCIWDHGPLLYVLYRYFPNESIERS